MRDSGHINAAFSTCPVSDVAADDLCLGRRCTFSCLKQNEEGAVTC